MQDCLYLGNLSARRDWGHARDYVEAMWRILQPKRPDDFVIATGVQHSVREFVEAAAAELEMKITKSNRCWATPPRRGGYRVHARHE